MPDFGRWNNSGGDPSLNEINRTDQFLDALAGQQPVYSTDRGEAELAQLLAGWRDDVRETPMSDVLTLQEAAAALDRVSSPGRRRRVSLAVVGSAAAAVLCLGGFGAVVAGSGPGDALYGLRTVLFGEQEQTRDDAVALAAQTEMQQVQKLIEQGDWQGAQAKLESVTTTVATVGDDQRKAELVSQWQELTVKVEAQNPAATVAPGAPLPTFPVVSIDPNAVLPTSPSETTSVTSPSVTSPSATSSSPVPSDTTTSGEAPSSEAPSSTAGDDPLVGSVVVGSAAVEHCGSDVVHATARSVVDHVAHDGGPVELDVGFHVCGCHPDHDDVSSRSTVDDDDGTAGHDIGRRADVSRASDQHARADRRDSVDRGGARSTRSACDSDHDDSAGGAGGAPLTGS
ncbi:MAG: anti-sigma-D factor RsdA [Mycobacterium kyogaense]|uniref:anti-sigma-D factor RsdA n=1 Tax=Mycobacterium kyogaense TaxID=2212479 RepID=UPI002FF4B986